MTDIYSRIVAALEYLAGGDYITATGVLEDLARDLHPRRCIRLDDVREIPDMSGA